MSPEFVQWMIGQAGIGGLAAFALFLLNKSWKDRLDEQKAATAREQQVSESGREDRRQLIAVLTENAKIITENTRVVSSLQSTIENVTRDGWRRSGAASD